MNRPSDWPQLLQLVREYSAGRSLTTQERDAALAVTMTLGCSTVPGALGCSLSLATDPTAGTFATVSSSGVLALALDQVQYRLDDGPCVSAARAQSLTVIDEMTADGRWPQLSRQALVEGVHQSMSVPMSVDRKPGALNFYGDARPEFGSPAGRQRAALVTRTASLLLNPPRDEHEEISLPLLRRVMHERSLIAQAQGIVMAREGMDAETAFHTLALRSAREKRRLADIADEIVESAADDANTGQEPGHGR
jgi:hypothetical protein